MTSLVDEGQCAWLWGRQTTETSGNKESLALLMPCTSSSRWSRANKPKNGRASIDLTQRRKEAGEAHDAERTAADEHSKIQDRETVFYPTPSHPVVLFCFF